MGKALQIAAPFLRSISIKGLHCHLSAASAVLLRFSARDIFCLSYKSV